MSDEPNLPSETNWDQGLEVIKNHPALIKKKVLFFIRESCSSNSRTGRKRIKKNPNLYFKIGIEHYFLKLEIPAFSQLSYSSIPT